MAVLLDAPVRAALARCIERLASKARGVGWVADENLHITLKFLGSVDTDRLDAVRDALGRAVVGVAAFDLAIEGLGAFPTRARPRVIWAGTTSGRERLAPLAARIDEQLAALGFPAEERPFSPHVTLGRVREPQRDPTLEAALAAGVAERFGTVAVGAISLMRSDLSPRGARYTELTASRLG